MLKNQSHQSAGLAIFLVISAASIGIAARFFIPGTVGQLLFIVTRIWILALPLIWFFWVERGKLIVSLPSQGECLAGAVLGSLMFGMILSTYWLVWQHWINIVDVRSKAQQIGIASPTVYLLSAFYFTVINSLAEEYIWRWFIGRKCEILFSRTGAIFFTALCFTLHHIIALAAYTVNWLVVVVGSLGVFIAGAIWSWCYLTYRSLWACYISHLLADLAIALIGWHLLFGNM